MTDMMIAHILNLLQLIVSFLVLIIMAIKFWTERKTDAPTSTKTRFLSVGLSKHGKIIILSLLLFIFFSALVGVITLSPTSAEHQQVLSAANQGDANAQLRLGWMYSTGQGVRQNNAKALKWYRLAANRGDAGAQNNLGFMYEAGLGVPQNYKEAVNWYSRAASQGEEHAQNNLGWMYENGLGVPRNYEEAVKWYRRAANQGNMSAQHSLGRIYANGLAGVYKLFSA